MISLFSGKIGGGKTLSAVERIYQHVCLGLTVATNIQLNIPAMKRLAAREKLVKLRDSQFRSIDPNLGEPWDLQIPWGVSGSPVLVVLDEIHLFFNARNWQETQKKHSEMLSFLSQSRKACVDVIFIVQEIKTLDGQFRLQAERETYHVNLKDIEIPYVSFLTGPFPGQFLARTTRDSKTGQMLSRNFLSTKKLIKRFGPCYETLSFLDVTMEDRAENVERVEPLGLERVRVCDWAKGFLRRGEEVKP